MKTVSFFLALLLSFCSIQTEENAKKRVALTFDDGPHPKYTKQILEILDEYNVKATFFIIGCNAENYPELVKAESDSGHETGNHTYSHKRSGKCSENEMIDEIIKTDDIIYNITGKYPAVFRPPEGKINKELEADIEAFGKRTVLWTVDTRDWAHNSVYNIVKTVKNNVKDGSVILFHDYITPDSPTPEALKQIIPYLVSQGYEFVTVSELLNNS